jgi:Leucine-rich repeat (LRR) protein
MTEYKYTLSYRRRIRLCRIVTLDNLNKPIPIETTILICNNLRLAQLPKTPVSTCESIGNLVNLKELYCINNQLQALPKTPLRRL